MEGNSRKIQIKFILSLYNSADYQRERLYQCEWRQHRNNKIYFAPFLVSGRSQLDSARGIRSSSSETAFHGLVTNKADTPFKRGYICINVIPKYFAYIFKWYYPLFKGGKRCFMPLFFWIGRQAIWLKARAEKSGVSPLKGVFWSFY